MHFFSYWYNAYTKRTDYTSVSMTVYALGNGQIHVAGFIAVSETRPAVSPRYVCVCVYSVITESVIFFPLRVLCILCNNLGLL